MKSSYQPLTFSNREKSFTLILSNGYALTRLIIEVDQKLTMAALATRYTFDTFFNY